MLSRALREQSLTNLHVNTGVRNDAIEVSQKIFFECANPDRPAIVGAKKANNGVEEIVALIARCKWVQILTAARRERILVRIFYYVCILYLTRSMYCKHHVLEPRCVYCI